MPFVLHPQLEAETVPVTRTPLSAVRLMNDRGWPWLVLVPEREDLADLVDLDPDDRMQLVEEIALASKVLRDLFQPDKLNVAALGNQVRQLHVHVIARHHRDPAWPRPVWGVQPPQPYSARDREQLVAALQDAFTANRAAFAAAAGRTPEPAGESGFLAILGFTDR